MSVSGQSGYWILAGLVAMAIGCHKPQPREVVEAETPPMTDLGLKVPSRRSSMPVVFAVLVADTRARTAVPELAVDPEKNLAAVKQLLESSMGADRLLTIELRDEKARPAGVQALLHALPVGPADALFCYVAGHGSVATRLDADAHQLLLHGGDRPEEWPRTALRDLLIGKKARHTILVTEISAVLTGPGTALTLPDGAADEKTPPPAGSTTNQGVFPDPTGLLPGFQSLFFGASGLVDLNASAEGTRAWGGPVGFFTRGLTVALLELGQDPDATWSQAYGRIKSLTASGFRIWRPEELRRLQSPGNRGEAEERKLRELTDQTQQTSHAYYLTGTDLKIVALAEKKGGVVVAELARDSPVRAAGVKPGDRILQAQGRDIPTLEVWQQTIGISLQAGHQNINLRVRSPGGKPRDVVINLGK